MSRPIPQTDDQRTPAERWLARKLAYVLVFFVGIAMALALLVLIVYVIYFPGPIVADHGKWGEFGDYVAGLLNPAFAFLAFLALLLTLVLQNRELSISSNELANSAHALREQTASLELQNFERSFFALVGLYNENVRAIDLRAQEGNITAVGRDCFRIFYNHRLKKCYDDVLSERRGLSDLAAVQESYSRFFDKWQHEVGHCFRSLYRAFKFVDESDVADKHKYAGIMRAQLSSFELALLFYNSLHPVGAGFRKHIERYALLENMRLRDLFNPLDHVPLYDVTAYGDQDVSQYARKV